MFSGVRSFSFSYYRCGCAWYPEGEAFDRDRLFRKYCSPYEEFVSGAPGASESDRRMWMTPLAES